MLYTCQTIALCNAEIIVHANAAIIPQNYSLITIFVPDVFILQTLKLPADWKSYPHAHSTQQIGDNFLTENKVLAFKVPSAAVQGEFNYLINPHHKDFSKVKIKNIQPFVFDERLFKKTK